MQTTLPMESIVGDRYQVETLLGRGGFGAVYLVRDLRVRQNVFALKEVIDPDPRQRKHFTLEGDLLKRVDHPSLPRVYRTFDDPVHGRAYLLMDYIDGPNLEQLRRQRPKQRLPWQEVLALVGPIFEAVTYLHTQQPPIIHRDIKPSNIIAPASGERPVLVDLGIAKEFNQDATTTAVRHASPGYGAPEQYGSGTDPRTDIYGLGATLYALLSGTIPTDAFTRMTQYVGNATDPLPPLKQLLPDIPDAIASAIMRAMALESNDRFATVEEFWQALQAGTRVGPINVVVRPVPLSEQKTVETIASRPSPVPVSHPRRTWLALLFLLLAGGIVFASTVFLLPGLHKQQVNAPTITPAGGATATHRATPLATHTALASPTSIATSPPLAALPVLTSTYTGQLHDVDGSIDASMSLENVSQQQQNIHGDFRVGPTLRGNGPFVGLVNAKSAIQFTVQSTDASVLAPLFFSGSIHPDGSLSGQYCSLDNTGHCNPAVGGYGTWIVRPANSGS